MHPVGPTPLEALLRACVRLRRAPEAGAALAAAVRELGDGDGALSEAIEGEQVGPLLHRALGELGIVPAPLAERLRESY